MYAKSDYAPEVSLNDRDEQSEEACQDKTPLSWQGESSSKSEAAALKALVYSRVNPSLGNLLSLFQKPQ